MEKAVDCVFWYQARRGNDQVRWELEQSQTESIPVARKASKSVQVSASEPDRHCCEVVSAEQSESLEIDVFASQVQRAEVVFVFLRGHHGCH